MKMIKTLTSLLGLVPVGREKGEKIKPFKLPQVLSRFVAGLAILGLVGLMPSGGLRTVQATERAPVAAKASKQLGSVRNEVASTLLPGTRYDNIVSIGCGWASGVNFSSSYDWPSLLQSIMIDPAHVY